ncbi:hypothetical protein AWC19_04175 [Mycobacterium palustre]|uniref:DUF6542 domain-containing protein n=1 Tax=Mycobacterium palustre TaxID=153971 RepID=A0A1X1ZST8_9MYCO|nr:hypothetical protein AWC19_04175 [Mycobacterium palustre]
MPGVPWWAAVLIAITATAIGYGIDAGGGHKELTHVFAGLYIAGCVAAVLAVRQDGVFTAVIQPPLILFCAVPGAYWMFHGRKVGHLKDLLINCGYPLIERFPLMLGTAGGVLMIGLARWYFGTSHRTKAATEGNDAAAAKSGSLLGAVAGKLNSLLRLTAGDQSDEAPAAERKRSRSSGRSANAAPRTGRTSRAGSSASPASRSRHSRPALDDELEPLAERPRRTGRRGQAPPRDFDPADRAAAPRRPRRRPRPDDDPGARSQPREPRREPRPTRRNPYEWPYDGPSDGPSYGPTQRGGRFDGYDRYEPYEPSYEPRRRRGAPSANGTGPTHHPISRVRYRGEAPPDEPRAEPRAERRGRSRPPRPPAESWEYDV